MKVVILFITKPNDDTIRHSDLSTEVTVVVNVKMLAFRARVINTPGQLLMFNWQVDQQASLLKSTHMHMVR